MNKEKIEMLRTVGILGMILAAGVAVSAHADDKKDIAALYSGLSNAMKGKDPDAILKLGVKDFAVIDKSGKSKPMANVVKDLKNTLKMIQSVPVCEIKPTELKITGKSAAANANMHTQMLLISAEKGPAAKLDRYDLSKDVFVKVAEGWRFKSIREIDSKMTLNGKPFGMPSGAAKAKPATGPVSK